MKNNSFPNTLPKALRQQAALRKLKTPDVLAQQAALNTVMMGRKGGVHQAQQSRREQLASVRIKEAQREAKNEAHKDLHK
jgi:endonuclease/exonuclease/phosphatase family metal-dependent hydrolase